MTSTNIETAVFGGGCFWCTEAVFQNLKGVVAVMPGYAGGSAPNPTYEDVCSGTTGHAQVIKIDFDPGEISFRDLLEVFFATHDPTTPNRQGADVGAQYRSVVLYTTPGQKQIAEEFIGEIQKDGIYSSPVVTEVKPLDKFYEAEEYHRNYYKNNPNQGYCQAVINPKLAKFRQKYARLLME